MKFRALCMAVMATFGMLASVPAALAEDYPEKEITVVVNYGAGGGTDLSTRALADAAEEALGVPLKVVNRSGGSGTVGPTFVAFSDADGYTIGVTSFSPMAITPHTQKVPYSTENFRFLAGFARFLTGIAVPANSEFETIEDVITAAQNGQRITYGAASTIETVAMVRLGAATGTEFQWIRFGSGQEVSTAALSNTVDMIVADPKDLVPFAQSGELRILASASNVRLPGAEDVATLKEQGYDVAVESYAGIGAPSGITDEQAEVLEAAFAEAFKAQSFQDTLEKLGMQPAYFTGNEYRQLIEEGYEAMGRDLEALGLKTN